jgi:DNA ligase (NAD+)
MNSAQISALAARLAAASHAYHNGLALLMTDDEFDAGVDQLRAAAPDHPFLSQVGAAVAAGDEVALPIPLPSLNKIKPSDGSLEKWLGRFAAASYHVSAKLDGCSALWLPATGKLYTRGDGMRGRDISAFVPYIRTLAGKTQHIAVRGELIMRTDSAAIPAGKLARNIVAGALNRKEVDPVLFNDIRFVAYELVSPADRTPEDAYKLLRAAGYEVARATIVPAEDMTPARLSEIFSGAEAKSPYQMDGIVVAPNVARPASWAPEVRKGVAVNPADRVAWKTRLVASTATTTVRAVEWNVSAGGVIIPRVLFDTVSLAGANISAATGLHGRWIYENVIGPGASIEIRRAGDVIPQIIAVHTASPAGPSMPPAGTWAWDGAEATAVHIRPAGGAAAAEGECAMLTRALAELGAENVGPGVVAKLYAAGFRTIGQIYRASAADLATRIEGFKAAAAQRTYDGLRAAATRWTELNFMVASCSFGRGVGHLKLKPLLELEPSPAKWNAAALIAVKPAGLSAATIDAIVEAVPAYLAWRAETGLAPAAASAAVAAAAAASAAVAAAANGTRMTVVLTGFRDKALEAALQAAGHTMADTVSKKATHVVYPDGPQPASTKITKALELGLTVLSVSALRALLSSQ